MLRIFDHLPAGLLDLEAPDLAGVLGGPALIRIAGADPRPLLLSTLLHGNETTGWDALRRLLKQYAAGTLPRSLLLFIGNVDAARERVRHLDTQPDFNRIWCDAVGPEAGMAAQVLAEARRASPVACIDIHNTSGRNPVYAAVHRVDDASLSLARHFGSIAVLVTHPESLLSMALASIAPAITLECGIPGRAETTECIAEAIGSLMSLDPLPDPAPGGGATLQLLRTVARVRVPDGVTFSFRNGQGDLRFVDGLDAHNFAVMPAGTVIARLGTRAIGRDTPVLQATDEHGSDLSDRFFRRRGDTLITAIPWIPSLFSSNARIVRQDCLCYVMEPV
jgi:hypothetical protein